MVEKNRNQQHAMSSMYMKGGKDPLAYDYEVIYKGTSDDGMLDDPQESAYLMLKMKMAEGRCLTPEEGYKLNKLNEFSSYDVPIEERAVKAGMAPIDYLKTLQLKSARGNRKAQAILNRYHICPRPAAYSYS